MEIVYPPVIGAAKLMFRALGLKIEVDGAHHVPRTGGAVLASNHISYLDFIFCGLGAQPSQRLVRFMAKKEIFAHPVAGPLMRGMHHICVDRDAGTAAYREAIAALKNGEVIGVFPEATVSVSFTIKELKSGAARMARFAKVPLIPMVVWGPQRLWTKARPKNLTQRNIPIRIKIGEPIEMGPRADPEEVTGRLHSRLEEMLSSVQQAYPDRPRGPEDSWWLPAHLGGTAPAPRQPSAGPPAGPAAAGEATTPGADLT
ncbi:MAG TPA: lysophospholipid acyltransferase family protein [Catenuloplanes sp.]|jgi:1-acyl-sn-glycerol-3-phosphate acyltransferase